MARASIGELLATVDETRERLFGLLRDHPHMSREDRAALERQLRSNASLHDLLEKVHRIWA